MNDSVLVTIEERGLLSILLNRPKVRNALLPGMLEAMGNALQDHVSDPSVRVVLIGGIGASFCAGGDAKVSPDEFSRAWTAMTNLLIGIVNHPKPVVARVQGHAIGLGCSIAMAADFVIADADARFQWPFVKMGLVPEGTQLALRCMPPAMLRSFAFLGSAVNGAELAGAAVIHSAVPMERLAGAVDELVDKLIVLPDFGLRAIKESLNSASRLNFGDSLHWEGERQRDIRSSPDFAAARSAFFERAGVRSEVSK